MRPAARREILGAVALWLAVLPPSPAHADAGFQLPPIDAFAAMVDRPLFDPLRRPAPPAASTEPAGTVSGALRLAGLVKAENGRALALVANSDVKVVTRVGIGSLLNGWKVTRITAGGIDLVSGPQTAHVRLKEEIPPSP